MKKLLIFVWIIGVAMKIAQAQEIEQVLEKIEENNTELLALRKAADAKLLQNKTGLFLDNPEAEFHFLWGSPAAMGNRTDISITQSFDFPTVYSHQNKISDLKNHQVELNYLKSQKKILLEARQLIHQVTFINAKHYQISERLEHAKKISSAYQTGLKEGYSNILDVNKAELNLLNVKNELKNLEIERERLMDQLQYLNGGEPIHYQKRIFDAMELPQDFDEWYAEAEKQNPMLNWLKKEIAVSQQQIKLSKARSLPKLNAGYMTEGLTSNQFQGFIVGMSIPLWENKNSVKYAQVHSEAMLKYQENSRLEFYNQLQSLFNKAKSLETAVNSFKRSLSRYQHKQMLDKALEQGQITLIEHLMELSIFYKSEESLLEMQKDLHLTIAELYWFL